MSKKSSAQIEMLKLAAKALKPILNDIVFVGGSTTVLYVNEAIAEHMRPTEDVDCVIKISSRVEYTKLEVKLRKIGLKNSTKKGAPLCRWLAGELIIDILPTDPTILGFSNRWYSAGLENRIEAKLGDGISIFILPLPYFLASKLEAFIDRGVKEPRLSKDLEDIVLVLDGNPDPISKYQNANAELKKYFEQSLAPLMRNSEFQEALSACLPSDARIRFDRVQKILLEFSKYKS